MGVMMRAFYWDCPKLEGKEYQWWSHVKSKLSSLNEAGFTALWLPPANKSANIGGQSMGYDPYDYYDLGDIDQKGSVKNAVKNKAFSLLVAVPKHGVNWTLTDFHSF